MTEPEQPSPAVPAARAFRTRLAAAAAIALVVSFVLIVLATPRAVSGGNAAGPTTSLTFGPPDPPAPRTVAAEAPDDTPADEPPATEDPDAGDVDPEATAPDESAATAGAEDPEPAEPTDTAGDGPAGGPVAAVPPPSGPGAPLWGRWYRAEHLREADRTAIVAGDRPLYVGFLREADRDRIVWLTSCNAFGAALTIGADRLDLTDLGGSVDDCGDETLADQELWLVELFAEDPRWRHLGGRLRLWAGDRRIDLVEDAAGPGAPWS